LNFKQVISLNSLPFAGGLYVSYFGTDECVDIYNKTGHGVQ